jgi:hypothetical protein
MKVLIEVYMKDVGSLYVQYEQNDRSYELDYKRIEKYKDEINHDMFRYTTERERLETLRSNLLFYIKFTNTRKL